MMEIGEPHSLSSPFPVKKPTTSITQRQALCIFYMMYKSLNCWIPSCKLDWDRRSTVWFHFWRALPFQPCYIVCMLGPFLVKNLNRNIPACSGIALSCEDLWGARPYFSISLQFNKCFLHSSEVGEIEKERAHFLKYSGASVQISPSFDI